MIDKDLLAHLSEAYRSIRRPGRITDDNLGSWQLCYAYESSDVVERLGGDGHETVKAFLVRRDKSFARDLIRFEDTSSAATMNPHKVLKDECYYVKTPTFFDLDDVIELGSSPQLRLFVHLGSKGSGKTATQNQWLHARHKQLEEKQVFYVRCDAAKLFDFWALTTKEDWSDCPTVEEYLDLQMLYVLGKYAFHEDESQRSELAVQVCSRLRADHVLFEHLESRDIDRPVTKPMAVIDYIEQHVVDAIRRYEVGNDEISYVRDSMFHNRKTKRREWFRWLACSRAVAGWMQANDYWLLRILDGVDNLHLNTSNGKKCYQAFLPQLIAFAFRAPATNEIRLVAMREKTFLDACLHDPTTTASTSCLTPIKIHHIPPKLSDVLEARATWVDTDVSKERHLGELIRAVKDTLGTSAIFNNNYRNVIVAVSALVATIRFRQLQSAVSDIRGQAAIQWKRNLLLQYRYYLSTERIWFELNREKGVQFFNPFWIPEELLRSRIGFFDKPLLARIRLLEYLECVGPHERDSEQLLDYMSAFGYGNSLIVRVLEDATAFGWVETIFKNERNPSTAYEVTSSGRFVLNELLHDVDSLYACALDTLLPESLLKSGAVRVHSNHLHTRTGYRGASISTVVTLLVLLGGLNQRELACVQGHPKYRRIAGSHFLNRTSWKTIWKQMRGMLRECNEEDKQDLRKGLRAARHLWDGS